MHAQNLADLRHFGAEPAEAEERQRLALEIEADGRLPHGAGLEAGVLVADAAGEFEHQADGERGGGIAERRRAADDDVPRLRGFEIDRGVAHAGRDQEFQVRQRLDHRARERGALAHGADDGEIFQRGDDVVRRAEVVVEYGDVDIARDLRPVGHGQRDVLIVVENGAAQRHVVPRLHSGAPRQRRQESTAAAGACLAGHNGRPNNSNGLGLSLVMPALVAGIHVSGAVPTQRRGWPGQSGHDERVGPARLHVTLEDDGEIVRHRRSGRARSRMTSPAISGRARAYSAVPAGKGRTLARSSAAARGRHLRNDAT